MALAMAWLVGLLAAAICAFAGASMLSINNVGEQTVFVAMSQGIGIYFIGKAFFIVALLFVGSRPLPRTGP